MSKKKKCTPREFVEAWQSSESVPEVAEKTGLTIPACRGRVSSYRKHGVPLRKMRTGAGRKKTDWSALADFAREVSSE